MCDCELWALFRVFEPAVLSEPVFRRLDPPSTTGLGDEPDRATAAKASGAKPDVEVLAGGAASVEIDASLEDGSGVVAGTSCTVTPRGCALLTSGFAGPELDATVCDWFATCAMALVDVVFDESARDSDATPAVAPVSVVNGALTCPAPCASMREGAFDSCADRALDGTVVDPAATSVSAGPWFAGKVRRTALGSLDATPDALTALFSIGVDVVRDVNSAADDGLAGTALADFEPRVEIDGAWGAAGVPGAACAPASSMVMVASLFVASFFEPAAFASLTLEVATARTFDEGPDSFGVDLVVDDDVPERTPSMGGRAEEGAGKPVPRVSADPRALSGTLVVVLERGLSFIPVPLEFWPT